MRQAIINLADRRKLGGHPGLILQRYLKRQSDSDERRALFDAMLQAARGTDLHDLYAEAFQRWTGSFTEGESHQSAQLATTSRLIVGLGSESVLETGLRLHHTYGVPVIPGSALKGLASHYCHDVWGQWCNEDAPDENQLFRRGETHHSLLFGTTDDGGVITFHDAWITPPSLTENAFRLDVMTPHHTKWQTNQAPPTDFDSPTPVSFLSVYGTFDVRVSWSGPPGIPPDRAEAWTALAMKLLQEALAEWGVGGKTSSGYGRLAPPGARQSDHPSSAGDPARKAALPRPGAVVEAKLLEERTRKGGWKALHEPSGLGGPIQNSGDVPADKGAGNTVRLIVAIVDAQKRELAFRYSTPADEARAQRTPDKDADGRRGSNIGRARK